MHILISAHLLEVGDGFLNVNLARWLEGEGEDAGWLSHVQFLGLQHRVVNAPSLRREKIKKSRKCLHFTKAPQTYEGCLRNIGREIFH